MVGKRGISGFLPMARSGVRPILVPRKAGVGRDHTNFRNAPWLALKRPRSAF